MNQPTLHTVLRSVVRRRLWLGTATVVCWTLAAAGLLLLVGVWMDIVWDLPPEGRIGVLIGTFSLAILGLGILLWREWRDRAHASAARRLDETGGFGGAILSAWELSDSAGRASTRVNPLTSTMSAVAVGRTSEQAASVPISSAVSSRPVRRGAIALAVFAGIVLILAMLLPSLAQNQWRRFASPYADVPPYSPLVIVVEPGDFELLYGEGMVIRATVDGGVAENLELMTVRESGEKSLDMFPEAEASWRADLARIDESLEYYVRADRARSERFNVRVITTPKINDVRFHITPPEYTGRSAYDGPLPKGGLSGLPGTRVRIEAKSNRPLSGGEIVVSHGDESRSIPLSPVSTGDIEVAGEFSIEHDGKFELTLTDIDGQMSQETFGGAIVLLHDQRPFVRLLSPKPQSLATPEAMLPVSVAAEDDFGVARLALYRSLNQSRPFPKDEPLAQPFELRIHDQSYLPLAQYGLLPGDEIRLFARVEDNDPSAAKGSESNVVTVRIVSQEDFERMVRTRQGLQVLLSKYQQARRRMEALAKEMAALEKELENREGELTDADREKLQELQKKMTQAAAAIEESAKHFLPYDLDKNLTDELKKLAEAVAQAAKELDDMQSNPQASAEKTRKQLSELAKKLAGKQNEFKQNAMQPLERFAAIFPLMEDQSRFMVLVKRQRDLAERLAAVKHLEETDDPKIKARMRDLEEEQRMLGEQLQVLLEDIEKHALQLPDEPELEELRASALTFVAEVRASGAAEEMSSAESALTEFSGLRGHKHAEAAAEILESFISKCQGMGGKCEGAMKFSPSLSQCMGNSAQQMLAEAGLGMGSGSGAGAGSGNGPGYSARRGAGNVGLYGGLPALTGGGNSGDGFGTGDVPGEGAGGERVGADQAIENVFTSQAGQAAGGVGSGRIPPRYRQRVGWYFRRIAEETSEN